MSQLETGLPSLPTPKRRLRVSRATWVKIYRGVLASCTIGIAAGWLSVVLIAR
jgi:hypothetical protein